MTRRSLASVRRFTPFTSANQGRHGSCYTATRMKYLALLALAGCMVGDEVDEDTDEDFVDTTVLTIAAGGSPNGSNCIASPYNCRFHAGGSRVENAGGGEVWAVVPGASVRDGNG